MAEISKELKLMLVADVIVAITYGVLYVFAPNVVYSMNDAPYYDPHFWRLFGGVLIGIGVVAILAILNGDWDNIKMFLLYAIIFLLITGIVNLSSAAYATRSATNIVYHWIDNSVIIVFFVLNLLIYMREEKK